MLGHTRKHHIKKQESKIQEEGKNISADDFYKQTYGDFPKYSVYLAGLRYREDLTQKQLGELINVKQSNISLMERGKRPIGKDVAKRLGKFFKTDYRCFL